MGLLKRILLVVDGAGVMTHTAPLVTALMSEGATVRVSLTPSARTLVGDFFTTKLCGNALLPFPELPEAVLKGSDAVLCVPASEPLTRAMVSEPAWQERWAMAKGPVIIAPGLLPKDDNESMWKELRGLTSKSVATLLESCGEQTDMGALGKLAVASPGRCLEAAMTAMTRQNLKGRRILITAGPTAEDLDPVRFITNRSTGRMGVALARMAAWHGADVTLIHGPMSWPIPPHEAIHACPVRSAQDMHDTVMKAIAAQDVAILCAAVADFTPVDYSAVKIKKAVNAMTYSLPLKRTPDILEAIGSLPEGQRPFLIGFAAESDHVKENASSKLKAKHCDMLCANDVTQPGCGFSVGTNQVTVFLKDGGCEELPMMSKESVATKILIMALDRLETNVRKNETQSEQVDA